MKKELLAFIDGLKSDEKISFYDETCIKQAIVLHVLHLLDWDWFNVEEVFPEYPVTRGNIDYALRHNYENKAFILVKHPAEKMEKFVPGLLETSIEADAPLAVVTNGIEWWFYLPVREEVEARKKFFNINILQQDSEEIVEKFITFLAKDRVLKGKALDDAEKVFRSRKKKRIIKEALMKLWNDYTNTTENKFVGLLAQEAENLCGYPTAPDDITGFLRVVLKRGRGRRPSLKIEDPKPRKKTKIRAKKTSKKETARVKATDEKKETKIKKTRGRKKSATRTRSDKFRSLIGKKPKSFTFLGRRQEVKKWKEVLINVCNILSKAKDSEFEAVLALTGRKRTYFSRNPEDLKEPRLVNGTEIYVETNFNASNLFMIALKVIRAFGYDENDIKIETR